MNHNQTNELYTSVLLRAKSLQMNMLVALFLLMLAACGGGGGGSSNSDSNNDSSGSFNTVVPEESLLLNRSNATAVALHVSRLVLDVEDLVSAINIGVIINAAKSSQSRQEIQSRRVSVEGECESGSISTSEDIHFNFNDCEYSNSLYNGKVELDIVNVGNPQIGGEYSFAGDGIAKAFMITQGERNVRMDGSFDISTGSVADTEVLGGVSMDIDGLVGDKPLYLNENGETTRLAGGYGAGFTSDHAAASPIRYSQTLDGRIASTAIGGQVTVESSLFSGTDNNFPGSGELEIFGANGSKVELEVLNEDTVQISVDTNGDDDFDDAQDGQESMTWRAFLGI